MMKEQKIIFESGNELAAYAAKQINYHVMGYFPITPSTQIAEELDLLKAEGEHDIVLVPADGEHSAAGICYGATTGGGRVFNATSANGLLYALEQLPVQSGTRFPMVMNVACRTVSGPLSIKGDHSDIMYVLNTGWVILYAKDPQAVYDMNLCALKIAERTMLPVIVAFDGFFTSHQKRKVSVFAQDEAVTAFVGEFANPHNALDPEHPVSIGCYMNEPDLMNNKFQLHLAMEEARDVIPAVFAEYAVLSGRRYGLTQSYRAEDADVLLYLLGSSYDTAKAAVDRLREAGKKVGIFTTNVLRPLVKEDLYRTCHKAKVIVACDRQDSYGAQGGNLSIELKSILQEYHGTPEVITRVYGLSGRDFYIEEAVDLFEQGSSYMEEKAQIRQFDYLGIYTGQKGYEPEAYFEPVTEKTACPGVTSVQMQDGVLTVKGGTVKDSVKMPKRLAPGHGACPGCGIPVNVNLLLKGIEGNVVLLFQTGCGMVVTTAYPKTAFKTSYVHNLFQNGASTLSGLVEMYKEKQRRGELPQDQDITFIMVSGDGGLDIGMGSALGAALRNHNMIIMEYDNGGYMNTGYQLSYTTPRGAKSSTSHIGKEQAGKQFFHKDMPQIMAASNIPYVATLAESNPADFIKKAAKAQWYAKNQGLAYVKAISACPLNWGDVPQKERSVIEAAVNSCYHPLYEVENGITKLNYNPENNNKKIPVLDWLKMMGSTKHLGKEQYRDITDAIQTEVDRRFRRLVERSENPLL